MIETRERLIHVLTEAAEVEHNLLCSYLYAAFSLKRESEIGAPAQGKAVERWRKAIMSVAMEEMAHLACVNNLLLAVGGAPHFDRPNLPVSPGYHPARIVVRLTPFDQATLDHFVFLERPQDTPLADGPGFRPIDPSPRTRSGTLTPSAVDYDTIGELYDALSQGFQHLAAAIGEHELIDPLGRGQLRAAVAGLPNVEAVTSLRHALETIERIKEQGEGSSGRHEDSHFDRFRSIRDEWRELLKSDPGFEPAWPAAADPVMRRPLDDAVRVWVTAPAAADHLDLGNAAYGMMLTLLNQIFGLDDGAAQARLMKPAALLMEVAAGIGSALARMPAADGRRDVNAGLTFAVPRNLGIRPTCSDLQHRERFGELRRRAASVLQGEFRAETLRRLDQAARTFSVADASTDDGSAAITAP